MTVAVMIAKNQSIETPKCIMCLYKIKFLSLYVMSECATRSAFYLLEW
jgi:hypothetical protein